MRDTKQIIFSTVKYKKKKEVEDGTIEPLLFFSVMPPP